MIYGIEDKTLTALGDAVRNKVANEDGELQKYSPMEMVDKINDLNTIPPSAYELTGDCSYRFTNNSFNWYIDQCNNKIITKDITNIDYMFKNSRGLDTILFDLHMTIPYSYNSATTIGADCFDNTYVADDTISLKRAPNIYLKKAQYSSSPKAVIAGDTLLQELMSVNPQEKKIFIEDDTLSFFPGAEAFIGYRGVEEPHWLIDIIDFELMNTITGVSDNMCPTNLKYCDNLETIPSFPRFYNMNTSKYDTHWYDMKFTNCYKLQSIVLPRPGPAELTSNMLDIFSGVPSMKSVKFDVQDNGSPYTARWKSQSINMVSVGYQYIPELQETVSYLDEQYRIKTADDYERLKNNPKAWTNKEEYILYNHDKALETINTLPDTSAYGTNTIKFQGNAGSATDEGAINTLTAEEIAVAAAKGWTVSFV